MTASALLAGVVAAAAVAVFGTKVATWTVTPRTNAAAQRCPRWLVRRRRSHPALMDVATWCDHAARSLRSGASLTAAIADATANQPAMASVIEPVLLRVGRGRSLLDALDIGDVATATGLALTVLRSCAQFGGPAAAPLERAAATLRSRAAISDEQQAQSAQARLSARVLTFVPVALLLLLTVTDPKVRAATTTPAGLAVVTLGATFNAVGAWWMRRIIGRAA